jgi:hypothetical protein
LYLVPVACAVVRPSAPFYQLVPRVQRRIWRLQGRSTLKHSYLSIATSHRASVDGVHCAFHPRRGQSTIRDASETTQQSPQRPHCPLSVPPAVSSFVDVVTTSTRSRHSSSTLFLTCTTTTRSAYITDTACLQMINVVWDLETLYEEANQELRINIASFNVTRGPLVLDLASSFLQVPVGPQEHDDVFPDEELQRYAARVWASV